MAILKSPYEISLWEDVLVFVVEAGDSSITEYERSLPEDAQGQVKAQYYKEKKICVIGSNSSESPIRAVNPKFNCKTNGEKTLTFDIYSRYYDEEQDCFFSNPYIGLLTNERKVKLKYKDKWHDLIIKNVQENSETKVYSYTAKDIFVNELSKSGFSLEFNSELENNIGNLHTLANRVMDGTDWQIDEVGLLKQTKEEPLCGIKLAIDINAEEVENRGSTIIIPQDSFIYAFYSDVVSQSSSVQFLAPLSEDFKVDENHVVINAKNLIIEGVVWRTNEDDNGNITSYWPTFAQSGSTYELYISTEYRGKKLVITQDSEFDAFLGKYVDIYEDIDIDSSEGEVQIISPRGFVEYEYITPAVVQSYITNAKNYESTNGWHGCAEEGAELAPNVEVTSIPNIRDIVENFEEITTTGIESYLQVDITDKDNQALLNSGIVDYRKQINGFVNGQKYLFRIDCDIGVKGDGKDYISDINTNLKDSISGSVKVCEYTVSDGKYIYDQDAVYFNGNFTYIAEENRYGCELTCGLSLSYEDMLSKSNTLGLFIKFNDNQTYLIKEVQLFRKVEVNGEILTLETPVSEDTAQIKTWYCYYDKNSEYTNLDNLTYLYRDNTPSTSYIPKYTDGGYTKTRTLNASESNRFNLLQDLCELFEVWVELYADHASNGAIELDENYCQKKHVRFYEDRIQNNYVGFKYGRNLKSIQRTVESDGIVSKLIVKNNSNEYATDGFCSIARSKENPSKENFIIDFGYYIRQQMLDLSTVTNDLYLDTNGYLGYYKKLREWNTTRDILIQWQSGLLTTITQLKANHQTYSALLIEANNQLQDKYAYIYNQTGYTFEELIALNDTPEEHDGEDTGEEPTEQDPRVSWLENEQVLATLTVIARLISNIASYQGMVNSLEEQLVAAEALNSDYSDRLNFLKEQKEILHQNFYNKYSRFLQEGSWISEDYIDDTLYYLDAQSTLYTSAYPKVSYEINVLELSHLPGYEDIKFELGDLTTMEDTEFFGWSAQNVPYKEQIVVTEITYALDSPIDNKIKVQNFKTQFEDLFQRMAATAQNVEFSSGEYRRAADVVNADGTINIQTLQSSIENNALILSNANDQSVFWDEYGITTVSLSRPSEIVRIVSGGIFLSIDGGVTWTTGITANGINASTITTGQLNTERINILNGSFPSFRWDKDGLSAYEFSYDENTGAPTGFNSSKFIRFDQFGLYGINGHPNFNPLINDGEVGEDKIKRDASFALTWDGFMLKSSHGDGGYVSITSDNDIQVFDATGVDRVKLGYLDNNNYGLQLKKDDGDDGKVILQQRADGTLWVEDVLNIQPGDEDYQIKIGHIPKLDGEDYDRAIVIGTSGSENFIVYEDGSIKANNGYFQGKISATDSYFKGIIEATGGTFTGTITATGGQIGGLGIQELVDKVEYQVKIQISAINNGDATSIFENGTEEKKLTAVLYKGTTEIEDNSQSGQSFSYKWYRDGVEMPDKTDKSIVIKGSEILRSAVYSCEVVYEYEKTTEDAEEGGT